MSLLIAALTKPWTEITAAFMPRVLVVSTIVSDMFREKTEVASNYKFWQNNVSSLVRNYQDRHSLLFQPSVKSRQHASFSSNHTRVSLIRSRVVKASVKYCSDIARGFQPRLGRADEMPINSKQLSTLVYCILKSFCYLCTGRPKLHVILCWELEGHSVVSSLESYLSSLPPLSSPIAHKRMYVDPLLEALKWLVMLLIGNSTNLYIFTMRLWSMNAVGWAPCSRLK